MGMGYFGSVGFMLAQVLLGLLLLLPVLRVILPLSRVRFGNPVCQAVYRATNPLLVPLGRVLPNWRGLSLGALVLAWLVAALAAWLLLAALGNLLGPLEAAALGFGTLLQFTLSLYFWAIVVVALMSFFLPTTATPPWNWCSAWPNRCSSRSGASRCASPASTSRRCGPVWRCVWSSSASPISVCQRFRCSQRGGRVHRQV